MVDCVYFQNRACPEDTVPAVAEQSRCVCCMLLIGLAGGNPGSFKPATNEAKMPNPVSSEELSSTFSVG